MVLHFSTDLQLAVKHQEMQQYANKVSGEEDYNLINIYVTHTGFKKQIYKCFCEEENAYKKTPHGTVNCLHNNTGQIIMGVV